MTKVHFEYGDSDLPASTIAAASAQTATIVLAVTDACTALVKHALKRAPADSPLAGLQVDEAVLRDIDVMLTDIPNPYTPLGLHGVGEIGMVGVAAAVANTVYNATGKRVRSLPITLDKLLV